MTDRPLMVDAPSRYDLSKVLILHVPFAQGMGSSQAGDHEMKIDASTSPPGSITEARRSRCRSLRLHHDHTSAPQLAQLDCAADEGWAAGKAEH